MGTPQYEPETGLADMPPVKREMATLMSLSLEGVTANHIGESRNATRLTAGYVALTILSQLWPGRIMLWQICRQIWLAQTSLLENFWGTSPRDGNLLPK